MKVFSCGGTLFLGNLWGEDNLPPTQIDDKSRCGYQDLNPDVELHSKVVEPLGRRFGGVHALTMLLLWARIIDIWIFIGRRGNGCDLDTIEKAKVKKKENGALDSFNF
jgi:hypothetical protein